MDRCPKCGQKKRRSNPANARYWLVIHVIADKVKPQGMQYSPETWHTYFKLKFLGGTDVKMPNGKVIVTAKSSADLPKDEFHEYAFKVEAWGNEHGAYLEEMPA